MRESRPGGMGAAGDRRGGAGGARSRRRSAFEAGLFPALAALAVGFFACGPTENADPAADGEWSPVLQAERQRPLTDRSFASTPERLARGEHLAHGILQCVVCHSPLDTLRPGHPPVAGREFSGAVLWDDEDGRMVAPNLTPDVETGAGSWTDDMLARAIREGVGHDGRGLGLPMYWETFRNLSDEDLASVIVYLRTVPAVRNEVPERRLKVASEEARRFRPYPLTETVPEREITEPWELGSYLVDLGDCVGCHTGWEAETNPGIFAGGNRVWTRDGLPVFSKNITPHATGIGGWSAEDFRWAMRTGTGGSMDPIMRWTAFTRLTDTELDAMYAALRRLPPAHHVVENRLEPTRCEICGQMHGLGHVNRLPSEDAGLPLDVDRAQEYVGRYHHPGWDLTAEVSLRDGELFVSEDGGPQVKLVRYEEEAFRGRGLPSPMRFSRDEAGRVDAVLYLEIREERLERRSDDMGPTGSGDEPGGS